MGEFYSKEIHIKGNPIPYLSAKEYEDPRDSAYLSSLKLNKTIDKAIKFAIEYGIERAYLIRYTGSHVQVTENNMPYLYNCVKDACEILGVEEIPNTYIVQDPYLNAMTVGSKHPILVLHDSLIKRFNHEELMFVIGHEIGHIKSEHCQYHTIGQYLQLAMVQGADFIPVAGPFLSNIVGTGLDFAIYDWMRKSEFTADHAGLLVCQDLKSAISAQAKLGGYPEEFFDNLDIDGFLQQAQNFDDLEDQAYNKVVKFTMTLDMTHPWGVQRAKELMLWVESGEYNRILLRSSTWLKKQLTALEKRSNEAQDKHRQKQSSAKRAIEKLDVEVPKDDIESEDVKGAKGILLKGQKNIKAIQNKIDESTAKRKIEQADDAKEDMSIAFKNEKEFRALYHPITEDVIDQHINETIGNLRRIKKSSE